MDNVLKLVGKIKNCKMSYVSDLKQENFYLLEIEIPRLSDTVDVLPVVCSEKLLYDIKHDVGDFVDITGQVRTRNKIDDEGRSHLSVYGYVTDINNVEDIDSIDPKDRNFVSVEGFVCREPRTRVTGKTKRTVTDIMVAVSRTASRSDYVPCIAWSRNAVLAGKRGVGDKVSVMGRFQSRNYYKKDTETTMITYEVSVADLQVLALAEKKEPVKENEEQPVEEKTEENGE